MAAKASDSPPPSPIDASPTNPLLVYPDPTPSSTSTPVANTPGTSPSTSSTLVPPSPSPLAPSQQQQQQQQQPNATIPIEDEDSRGNKLPASPICTHSPTGTAVAATAAVAPASKSSSSPAPTTSDLKPSSRSTPPTTGRSAPVPPTSSTSPSSSSSRPPPSQPANARRPSFSSRIMRLLRRAFGPCLCLGKSSSSSQRSPPARPPRPANTGSLSPRAPAMSAAGGKLGAVPEDRQVNSPALTPSDLITQVAAPGASGSSSPITQVQPGGGAPLAAVGWGRRTPSVRSAASGGSTAAKPLLPPLRPEHEGKKCLVLDLDETLVHSSFKLVPQADYVIPVEIDHQWHNVYVMKRPGLETFMRAISDKFEVVVFTASLAKYADPVLDMLDKGKVVHHRLFREACIHHKGNYVKDLSMLGRDLRNVIILDNSPASYLFHRSNAIPITSWFSDPEDRELVELVPFLLELRAVENVTVVLGDEDG